MFVLSYLGFYQVSKFWGIGGCGGSVMVIIYLIIVVSDNVGLIGAVMRKWLKIILDGLPLHFPLLCQPRSGSVFLDV